MGVLSFLKGEGWSKRTQAANFERVIAALDGGSWGAAMSGEAVNLRSAMRVSAAMACVQVIANGCATPQLNVYRELKGGRRELATNIPEYRMLSRRPNEWNTSFEFRKTMTMHAALCGDAIAIKVRGDGSRRVRELIPVQPGNFQILEDERYAPRVRCYDKFGLVGEFAYEDVLHIPNARWELIKSLDVLNIVREAVGLAIASERSLAVLHANGGRPAGILTTDQPMSPDAIERLKVDWKQFTTTNKNGTAILDRGMKFLAMSMSGADQQMLEQRRFQIEEVARAFGVFPIMIGHSDKTATYASAEAMFQSHLIHTLAPWHEAWKQRLDEFVLDGSGPLYVEFDTRYLTQGSMKDRAEWARTMIEMKIMTRNEVRDSFGLDAVEDGDEFWSPANVAGGEDVAQQEEPEEDDEEDDGSGADAAA